VPFEGYEVCHKIQGNISIQARSRMCMEVAGQMASFIRVYPTQIHEVDGAPSLHIEVEK